MLQKVKVRLSDTVNVDGSFKRIILKERTYYIRAASYAQAQATAKAAFIKEAVPTSIEVDWPERVRVIR